MQPAFVWTSSKKEWNPHNAIWSRAFRLSITRNLIKRVLTTPLVKLTQRTLGHPVMEQKRFDPRSLPSALRNLWLLLVLNSNFLCVSCPSASLALQHGGFVPREWLVAKGLGIVFFCLLCLPLAILHYMLLCSTVQVKSLHPSNLYIIRLYYTWVEALSKPYFRLSKKSFVGFHMARDGTCSKSNPIWALPGETLNKFTTMILFLRLKKWI